MKKILPAFLACCIITACVASCEKKSSDNESIIVYGETQKNGSGEDALRDFFTANYTRDAGETAFNYMYTQQMIDDMIEKNEYRQLIIDYNSGKNQMLDLSENVPSIKSIEEIIPLSEEQLGWAEQYLEDFTTTREITANDITVTEGYNFKYTVIDYNSNEKPNTACLVKADGEGWKFVGTLNGLTERYGTESAENTDS